VLEYSGAALARGIRRTEYYPITHRYRCWTGNRNVVFISHSQEAISLLGALAGLCLCLTLAHRVRTADYGVLYYYVQGYILRQLRRRSNHINYLRPVPVLSAYHETPILETSPPQADRGGASVPIYHTELFDTNALP